MASLTGNFVASGLPLAATESQLVDAHVVLRLQLLLRDVVVQVERQRAFLERVARVLREVRRDRREPDVVEQNRQIDEQILRERIDLSRDGERRIAVDLALEINRGNSVQFGGQSPDAAVELLDRRRYVRLDGFVGEPKRRVVNDHFADLHLKAVRRRRRRVGRAGSGFGGGWRVRCRLGGGRTRVTTSRR